METILGKMDKMVKRKRKNVKWSTFEGLENVLFRGFYEVCAINIPINYPIFREKPIEIASKLWMQGFTTSNGWTVYFKMSAIYPISPFGPSQLASILRLPGRLRTHCRLWYTNILEKAFWMLTKWGYFIIFFLIRLLQ